jgi:ATP/maltotriose-dependent transcriptional regulator MalT
MIYHCGFGDPTAGVAAARELQRLSEDEVDTSSRIKLFLNVADAERFCGDRTNSLPLLTDAYRLARRSSIDYLAVVAADKAASAYIEAGDLASATLWLDRASAHAAHCDDVDSAFDPLLTRARLLLAQGEYLACTSAWVQVAELAGATLSARRRRSALTFQALLALSTSDAPLHARLMEELRELHELLCRRTAHDTTAFVIAESFKRAGQKHEARSLLSAYLFEYRRGYHTTPDYLYKLLEWAKA